MGTRMQHKCETQHPTDLVIRVLKGYTSIGQDNAYVGVKSRTMANKSPTKFPPSRSWNRRLTSSWKSRECDESWSSPKFATVRCMRGDCNTSASSNSPTRCILRLSAPTPCISKDLFSTSPFSIQAISRLSWSGLHTQTNSPKEEHHQKPDPKSSSHPFAVWQCQPTQEKYCIAEPTPYFSGVRWVSMPLHYLLRLHTLLFEGFVSSLKLSWRCTICCRCTPFSSFHACALSATAHLASSRIFSSFHAFALSAAAMHHLVQKKRYLIHDSTGLAPRHKNQSSKAFNPPHVQGSPKKRRSLPAAGLPRLAPTDNFRDRSRKAQGNKVQGK